MFSLFKEHFMDASNLFSKKTKKVVAKLEIIR